MYMSRYFLQNSNRQMFMFSSHFSSNFLALKSRLSWLDKGCNLFTVCKIRPWPEKCNQNFFSKTFFQCRMKLLFHTFINYKDVWNSENLNFWICFSKNFEKNWLLCASWMEHSLVFEKLLLPSFVHSQSRSALWNRVFHGKF